MKPNKEGSEKVRELFIYDCGQCVVSEQKSMTDSNLEYIHAVYKTDYDKALSALREAVEALALYKGIRDKKDQQGHRANFGKIDLSDPKQLAIVEAWEKSVLPLADQTLAKIKASFPELFGDK